MNTVLALKLLDVLLLVVSRVPALVLRMRAIRDEVKALPEGEVEDADWEAVGARIDAKIAKRAGPVKLGAA